MRAFHCCFRVWCLHNRTLYPCLLQAIMIDICVMLFVIVRSYLPAEIRWSIALAVRGQPAGANLICLLTGTLVPACHALKLKGTPCCPLLLYKAVARAELMGSRLMLLCCSTASKLASEPHPLFCSGTTLSAGPC